jgi:hypothetical protein
MTLASEKQKFDEHVAAFNEEYEKLTTKNIKASAAKSRKSLGEIKKLTLSMRKLIMEYKNNI